MTFSQCTPMQVSSKLVPSAGTYVIVVIKYFELKTFLQSYKIALPRCHYLLVLGILLTALANFYNLPRFKNDFRNHFVAFFGNLPFLP